MPPITRLFVKTALAWFVAALIVGVLLALRPLLPALEAAGALWPVYWHLFMVGWVTQLIAGIAYWMFPKFSRDQPRGSDRLAWATYALLNGGLLLRALAEPALAGAMSGAEALRVLVAASAFLQWAGGMAFVANTWTRVKEK
jgi:cbb3-type cytochrome oxidase subunit 1